MEEVSEPVNVREVGIWNALLEHEARRECAPEHWHGELLGHANALARLGVISEEDLREMLELADAAFGHVIEEKEAQAWLRGKTD
jgi:hypothetical protein